MAAPNQGYGYIQGLSSRNGLDNGAPSVQRYLRHKVVRTGIHHNQDLRFRLQGIAGKRRSQALP